MPIKASEWRLFLEEGEEITASQFYTLSVLNASATVSSYDLIKPHHCIYTTFWVALLLAIPLHLHVQIFLM